MPDLWSSTSDKDWQRALDRYEEVIAAQGSERLPELDRWYREELPSAIAARSPHYLTLEELAELTKWKMVRGEWRARNLALVSANSPEEVEEVSRKAFALIPDERGPIRELAKLGGVGPATASAAAAAAAPAIYPFFDDLAAAQVPDLGPVDYTLRYYVDYATALRDRASRLGDGWTPVMVERALWSNAGGKAGIGR